MGMLDHIKSEWDALKGAPVSFAILLILGLGVGFKAGLMFKDEQVQVLKDRIEYSDKQISDLKDRLKQSPASIDIFSGAKTSARAAQLTKVFMDSGWNVNGGVLPDDGHDVIVRASDKMTAAGVFAAFKAAGIEANPTTKFGSNDLVVK